MKLPKFQPREGGWTDLMSYHGLSGASDELKSAVRKCSIAFKEFHGVGATLKCDNIEETVDYIKQKHPDINLKIVYKFATMKFHQRIKVIFC